MYIQYSIIKTVDIQHYIKANVGGYEFTSGHPDLSLPYPPRTDDQLQW